MTEEQFNKAYSLAPSKDLVAAKIAVLNDLHNKAEGMPYVDFWHYLRDHDFMDVSNGSVHSMWIDSEAEDQEDDGIVIPAILYDKMREAMFKEISQYSYYNNQKPNEIEFYISW